MVTNLQSDYARQSSSTFVDAYYITQTWRQIYAEEVMPLPDQCEWNVPSDIFLRIIGTPTNPKQAERPCSKRIFSGYHKIQGCVCSRCHKQGHYQNSCTTFLGTPPLEEVSSNQSSGSIPRKPKKCGICGVPGHTRLTCQDPHRL
ncbi:Zinc finger CCHC domain-containing protein 7 [Orobanche gracilis]